MTYEQPQNIRVFVSSTFVDLFGEREYLVKRVFPEIRHICRERGLIFTEVDLRWGLTYEDSSFGRVISTCLQEIDRCRPFFIGILGDRYGWIPEFQDIHKNAFLMEEHRWLEEAVLEGSSLVEMEFNYAVLNSLEPMPGASFYILERPELGSKPRVEQDELSKQKLDILRNRIFNSKRPVRTFSNAKELGNLVREDLLRAIDVLHPAKNERHPLQRERRLHEAFSISRRQAYVARQETLKRLTDHALGDEQPLIVHGASGLGKSALLAYWSRFFAQRHPDKTVVAHFIGSVSSDTGHEGLLRRILMEIKDLLSIEDEVPNSVAEMESALTGWLAKVPEKKLILVIDALNQLEPRAAGLEWLPQHLPTNVRIIFSTTPGPTLDALRTREWPEFELLPLSVSDREAMITRFLSEFHKSLSLDECKEIARNEKTASPLFLRTFLEELRLFGTFEKLDEQIEHYLASHDIGDLFQRVLERIESDFGIDLIRKVMSYVWASKSGLTEDDLLALTKLPRAEASQLLITLEYHLVQRQGYIRFFHDYLREAVERKYLSNDESRKAAHAELGSFYLSEPSSERRASELPYQLGEGGMLDELKAWLTDIPEFMRFATEDEQWRYIGYWLKLEGKYERAVSYEEALEKFESEHTMLEYAEALEAIGRFMNACGDYAAASLMLEESLPIIESTYGDEDEHTASALTNYGVLLSTKAEYARAEEPLKKALAIFEKLFGPDDAHVAKSLDRLATLYYSRGKYSEAEELLRRALAINERALGPQHPRTIETLMNVGVMLYSRKKYSEAEEAFESAKAATLATLGNMHPEYAARLCNLAATRSAVRDYEAAVQLLEDALRINEQLLGPDHPATMQIVGSLGVAMTLNRKLEQAEKFCRRALDHSLRMRGIIDPQTARAQLSLGQLLAEKKEYQNASELLMQAKDSFLILLGQEHTHTASTNIALASVYMEMEEYSRACELYDSYFELYARHGTQARDARDVEVVFKKYQRALTLLNRSQAAEELVTRHSNLFTPSS